MTKWFTFSYNNISCWKEKCRKCGKVFPKESLDKNNVCEDCLTIKAQDVIRDHRGLWF